MIKWGMPVAALSLAAAIASTPAAADDIDVIMALPSPSLTFSAPFLAEDAGFYKQAGLKVTHRYLVGVASMNAVISGSVDFAIGTGPVFLRAAAQGQPVLGIANLIDKPLVELVLRKDVAAAAGITEKSPFAERAKALKGKTIAIQGVGSIVHAWERYVAAKGGLDVEKDVRIAPMDPPAMRAAMNSKSVDGFATSLPFTTEAVAKGEAIMLASAATDAPELLPFAYGVVETRTQLCKEQAEKCTRIVKAYEATLKFMHEKPDEALALLKKRFDKIDPDILATAWKTVLASHATDPRISVPMLEHSEEVSIVTKLLKPEDKLKEYEKTFTNDYVK